MKLILLNGPKGSGKDEAAKQMLAQGMGDAIIGVSSIMRPSKVAALRELGISANAVDYYETCKDEAKIDLAGKTPRQVYIDFGERERAKNPNAIVGLWLADLKRVVALLGPDYAIVPDCRFEQELIAAVELVGVENVCLVNLYRPGHTWDGDIGRYLGYDRQRPGERLEHLDYNLYNDGPLEALGEALAAIVEQWEAGATFVEKHTGA